MERILSEEIVLVQDLEDTRRGTKGFGSSDKELTKQSGAGAGLLNKQSCEVTGPPGHSSPQNGKIQISEITEKEFRQAYKNGETTGVLKFSQKEKQIYLRKINISTELAI